MADRPTRPPQNKRTAARDEKGRLLPGQSGNPGGRPRKLVEIEKLLDREHRDVEKMRETFALVRKVAHGVDEPVYYQGVVCGYKRVYDGGWMELYLNRVLGPVKEIKVDLTDAPDAVVEWFAENLKSN